MLTVADVFPDVKRVLGGCDDSVAFSRLNDAVEILAAESEWDPLRGYVDVCADGCGVVTLPREVGTPLAVTIDGTPAQGHDFWFKYHLNGPGANHQSVGWHWNNMLPAVVFKQPRDVLTYPDVGAQLTVGLESSADAGKSFRVFGYGPNGDWIRTVENGVKVDGFLVPLVAGSLSTTNTNAPRISRIARIQKDETVGLVRLYAIDSDGIRQRIGTYFPDETDPSFRQIQLSRKCAWARVAFRKNVLKLARQTDLIPLHSKYAIVLMVKALKKFDEDRIEEGHKYRVMAVNLLTKKQESVDVPGGPSVQIADGNLIADKRDRLD